MKRAFITGITGFVGKYLTEYLQEKNYRVFGLDRWDTCSYPGVQYTQADILDTASLNDILSRVGPDELYHLAAISYPAEADVSPRLALEVNIIGTVSVLDAVRQSCRETRVLLIGSSKEYDDTIVSDSLPENTHPEPGSFYGISKYAGELIGSQYARQHNLDIRFSRSFNHTGPGQPSRFVCSDWAKQVADIIMGLSEPCITVGDTGAMIDFSDVRDVVRAYQCILENGKKGEVYNVCSGRGVSLEWILTYFTNKCTRQVTIRKAEMKLRAHRTNARMIGSNKKLTDIGWAPLIPFEKTLDDLLEYWLSQPR